MINLDISNVLVLLSGGIDSSTCIGYYIQKKYNIFGLYIDYGQSDAKEELIASTSIAEYYSIPLNIISINTKNIPNGYIPGRNAVLLSIALMNCPFTSGIVALGIHSGTSYQDCSPEFDALMQKIYILYEDGKLRIDTPFLNWEKSEIIDYAKSINVPLHLTFSTNN